MSEFSKNFMKWCGKNSTHFIETGTFKGATTTLASKHFEHVTTIEINEENYNFSKNKLKDAPNVTCVFGNTLDKLAQILENSQGLKCTFWLDAHPMDPDVDKSCPLLDELDMIKEFSDRDDHIILIDDLQRCFNSKGDYPSVEDLTEKLLKINPNYHITQLPFKSWQVKKGDPSILCATTEKLTFKSSFYINPFSFMTKYLRFLGLKD
jgi:hypothetical protein